MVKDNEIDKEYNFLDAELTRLETEMNELFAETSIKLTIEDRKLKDCLAEQPDLQVQWELLVSSIRHVDRRGKDLVDLVHGKAFHKEMNDSYRSISTTEARAFVSANDNYVRVKKLHNNIVRLKDDAEAVINTLKTRQFALKDLTNSLVAGVENHVI